MAQTAQLSITTAAWTQVSGVTAGMFVNIEAKFAFFAAYSSASPAFSEGYVVEDDKDTAASVCNFSDIALGSLWIRSRNVNQTVFVTFDSLSPATAPLPTGAATAANQTTTNTKLDSIITNTGVQFSGGAITATTQRVTLATDSAGISSLSSIDTKTPSLDNSKQPVIPSMTTGGNVSVTTAATGTNWTAFGSQALKQLTVSNQTGVTIEFRQDAAGVGIQIPDGAFFTFFGITNANQIGARRVDTSNTQVTVTARWES